MGSLQGVRWFYLCLPIGCRGDDPNQSSCAWHACHLSSFLEDSTDTRPTDGRTFACNAPRHTWGHVDDVMTVAEVISPKSLPGSRTFPSYRHAYSTFVRKLCHRHSPGGIFNVFLCTDKPGEKIYRAYPREIKSHSWRARMRK